MKTQQERFRELQEAGIERQDYALKLKEEGLTFQELADLLSVTRGRAYQIVTRAKNRRKLKGQP
jgi:orotate phosphoribosyltransferase-like protein